MTIDAIRRMEIGQIVDYVIEWNNVHSEETGGENTEKEKNVHVREATKADWNAFFG